MTSFLFWTYAAGGFITLLGYYILRRRKRKVTPRAEIVASNEVTLIIWAIVWPVFLPLLIWSAFFQKERKTWVREDEGIDE